MSEFYCVPAGAGSTSAKYDRYDQDGHAGPNGLIEAADLTAWVREQGGWAQDGAAALLRWPQIHCSLFRLSIIAENTRAEAVETYANAPASATDIQLLEKRLESKADMRDAEQDLRRTLGSELRTLLMTEEMKESCPQKLLDTWMAITYKQTDLPAVLIPDLCAAAIYYLGRFTALEVSDLQNIPLQMELARFTVLDARAAATAGTVGTLSTKQVGAPALVRDVFPPTTDGPGDLFTTTDEIEILAIDGISTLPMTTAQCDAALHGGIGSPVRLTVRTAGSAPYEITLTRRTEGK